MTEADDTAAPASALGTATSRTVPLAALTRERLLHISTATLTTVLFKHGFRNTFLQGLKPLGATHRLVGPAYTLRYIPAREDLDAYGSGGDPNNVQRQAIELVPEGRVLVVDCRGSTDIAGIGAILGRRLVTRGVRGVVLDGGVRDTRAFEGIELPTYCLGPSAPPNYAGHHAADMEVPIACGGVAVYPGDVIVGDSEAVIVIPRHLAEEIAADAQEMERRERFLFKEIESGRSIVGVYPPDADTTRRYEAAKSRGEA